MTKTTVKELLTIIFHNMIKTKDINTFNKLKTNFYEMFSVIPFSDSTATDLEKRMFETDCIARIESDFNNDTISELSTDFDRILILVSLSHLPE